MDGAFIAAGLASTALLVAKILDVVNAPLFVRRSDRATSRFGKRRPYMVFGAPLLAIPIVALTIPRSPP